MFEFLLKKVASLQAYNFIKKRLQHRCFPVNIAKFLRTAFLWNTSPVAAIEPTEDTYEYLLFFSFSKNKSLPSFFFKYFQPLTSWKLLLSAITFFFMRRNIPRAWFVLAVALVCNVKSFSR